MPDSKKSYQELQSELDEILLKLQAGEADAEESVKLYEAGLKLVGQLQVKLERAENQITKLKAGS